MDGLRDHAVEFGYAAAWRLVRALPRPVAASLFRAGADVAYRRGGRGLDRLAANLRRVVGAQVPAEQFDDLLRRAMRSYARYFMEAFQLPSRSLDQRLAGFRLHRWEVLERDVRSGRGAVVALPHAGNWDAAGAWVAARGWPIVAVAERLKPEALYERFLDFRRGLGMDIVPASGGAQRPFDAVHARVRQGYIATLLADRDLSARGIEVEFFGGRTRMPAGPALLALRTGAPLYVARMWYEPDVPAGYLDGPLELPGRPGDPIDQRVRATTQMIADRLATGIAGHPEDWHMLQRMWLDDGPPPAAGTVVAAAPHRGGGS